MVRVEAILTFSKFIAFGSLVLLAFLLGRASRPGIHNYSDRMSNQRKKLRSIKRYLRLLSNLKDASKYSLFCLFCGNLALHYLFFVRQRSQLSELSMAQSFSRWMQLLCLPMVILLLAKLTFFFLRKGIDRLVRFLDNRIGRMRNDEENYVKNVLNDLGKDLSRAIRDLQAKELSENNRRLESRLQSIEAAAEEQASEMNLKQKKIDAYRHFYKSLEEFAWCSDCIFWNFEQQEPTLDPLPTRHFESSEVVEEASTKSDTLKVDNLNIEKNSMKTSKSENPNSAKSSKCNKKCISRFLSLYEASKNSLESNLQNSNPLLSKISLLIPQLATPRTKIIHCK